MNRTIEKMSQEENQKIIEDTFSSAYNTTHEDDSCVYFSKSNLDTLHILSKIFEGIIITKCAHMNNITFFLFTTNG